MRAELLQPGGRLPQHLHRSAFGDVRCMYPVLLPGRHLYDVQLHLSVHRRCNARVYELHSELVRWPLRAVLWGRLPELTRRLDTSAVLEDALVSLGCGALAPCDPGIRIGALRQQVVVGLRMACSALFRLHGGPRVEQDFTRRSPADKLPPLVAREHSWGRTCVGMWTESRKARLC